MPSYPMPRVNNPLPAPTPPPSQRETNVDRMSEPHIGTHLYPPTPRAPYPNNPDPDPARADKPKRVSINIVTLNMNGFTAPASQMTGIDKWSAVNQTISTHKIAILALQETHLDPALLNDIETCFGKRLLIINSQDPMLKWCTHVHHKARW